ncbi:hypothetical protein Selin_2373 [Desulfurispirillum indicum S5]|uniref:Uncharacterized protein n=1 Tax=Desulfurispirillum indicum (strain ATCC BAA-1389 / DSM 22839 / S5) TaxID=653733 RepID=E6W4L6_DESIS|nr:hypothetical protein Selin_2373 [Desulfurispirillum indicum S5]
MQGSGGTEKREKHASRQGAKSPRKGRRIKPQRVFFTGRVESRFHPAPPPQTGHADFPHPAFLLPSPEGTRRIICFACRYSCFIRPGILPAAWLFHYGYSRLCRVCYRVSPLKQTSHLPITQHDNSKAPSLHQHYPVSALLWASPTPTLQENMVMHSHAPFWLEATAIWASQVPDQSVGTRCLQPPRRVRCMHLSVASATIIGFTSFGRMATLN